MRTRIDKLKENETHDSTEDKPYGPQGSIILDIDKQLHGIVNIL